jgi:hypothetical protein
MSYKSPAEHLASLPLVVARAVLVCALAEDRAAAAFADCWGPHESAEAKRLRWHNRDRAHALRMAAGDLLSVALAGQQANVARRAIGLVNYASTRIPGRHERAARLARHEPTFVPFPSRKEPDYA